MNSWTNLPITFAPVSELSSWTPPIATNGVRASARFKVESSSATNKSTTLKLSSPSGVAALLQQVPASRRTFGDALSLYA
jgi:hypothetical protein